MTTTLTRNADLPSIRRSSSNESIYTVQGDETDIARDTSDTEPLMGDSEDGLEYEPVTASEHEAPIDEDTSTCTDDDIIKTEVIAVYEGDDGDLQLADSEFTDSYESATEFKRHYFLRCAKCKGRNTNPAYRYCYKCFTMRKNFFPPRPRRNKKKSKGKSSGESTKSSEASSGCFSQSTDIDYQSGVTSQSSVSARSGDTVLSALSGDSGLSAWFGDSGLSVRSTDSGLSVRSTDSGLSVRSTDSGLSVRSGDSDLFVRRLKRRSGTVDHVMYKKPRDNDDSGTETDMDDPVRPLGKTVSDPITQIEPPVTTVTSVTMTKKTIANAVLEKMETKDLCVVCVSEPKSGVFVHGRIAHICCCYRCAVKVWSTARRCPVCNCRVSNVLRAVVM